MPKPAEVSAVIQVRMPMSLVQRMSAAMETAGADNISAWIRGAVELKLNVEKTDGSSDADDKA